MKTLIIAMISLGAAAAAADQAVVKVYSMSVQERLEKLELIDVSAEKPRSAEVAPLEDELADILSEVEQLEQEIVDH